MLLLFVVTVALLFAVDTYNERKLIDKLENTMEAVTKAIEVASDQAQISATGEIDNEVLQDYAEKPRQRGVREIQILSPERAVIASSKRPRGKKRPAEDIAIKGPIRGNEETAEPKRDYRLNMTLLSQNQQVAYVTDDLLLDDYAAKI